MTDNLIMGDFLADDPIKITDEVKERWYRALAVVPFLLGVAGGIAQAAGLI